MKKLMLLGGSRYLLPVIETAHELGFYVITCDYLPDNIAHRYSDEYCNVNIVEKEKVLAAAREKAIDGIMSFATDPGVVTAAYVAEQLGLPTCPYESVKILQNKHLFRSFLKEHGFNVPFFVTYHKSDLNKLSQDAGSFPYPVIVKPVDSAGSKGVTRIDSPEQLKEAIQTALDYSLSGEIIIEEFLQQLGYSSDCDCFSINGNLVLTSFNNQHFDSDAANPYTPAAFTWPSTISADNKVYLKNELQRLMKLLHLTTSLYNVETRVCTNGRPYIMEVSPRGGGNCLSEMLRHTTGVDLIKASVLAAMGEEIPNLSEYQDQGYWAECIIHSYQKGIYDELYIDPDIIDYVVATDMWVKNGDTVNCFNGANQAFGTVILKFPTEEKMNFYMRDIRKYIAVKLL